LTRTNNHERSKNDKRTDTQSAGSWRFLRQENVTKFIIIRQVDDKAGINPNRKVIVTNPEPGVLIIKEQP